MGESESGRISVGKVNKPNLMYIYHTITIHQVDVEVSVRADKDALEGDEIGLQFIVRLVQDDGVTGLRDFSTDVNFKEFKPRETKKHIIIKSSSQLVQMIKNQNSFFKVTLTVRDLTVENDPTSEYTKEQEDADRSRS